MFRFQRERAGTDGQGPSGGVVSIGWEELLYLCGSRDCNAAGAVFLTFSRVDQSILTLTFCKKLLYGTRMRKRTRAFAVLVEYGPVIRFVVGSLYPGIAAHPQAIIATVPMRYRQGPVRQAGQIPDSYKPATNATPHYRQICREIHVAA